MPRSELKLTDPTALRGYAHPIRMALLGLLRLHGPMTATQAAQQLNQSVPTCSFHLRQLARYGLAERAPSADHRERPWQATAQVTSWDDLSDDPEMRSAADQLNSVILDQYFQRARAYLARRADEPPHWRAVTGFGDSLHYLTAAEVKEVTAKIEALLAEFDERLTDPSTRPAGARGIGMIQLLVPMPDPPRAAAPADPASAAAPADPASAAAPADPASPPPAGERRD